MFLVLTHSYIPFYTLFPTAWKFCSLKAPVFVVQIFLVVVVKKNIILYVILTEESMEG